MSELGGAWDRQWLDSLGLADRDAMAREMLWLFADRLPGCVYAKDLNSRLIFVNRYMRNVLGGDRWLGRTPADYLPKSLADAVIEHDRLALTDGQVLRQEFLPDVDGNLRAWRTCRFEIARPGLPSLIGCISLDISESHRAQQALRESEARYRAILEDQTEMICRFRSDGVIEYVNEAYCRYFGRSRESLVGKVYRPVVHPDDADRVEQEVGLITPEDPVRLIENRVVLQGGKTRWTQWINRGFFDREGRLLGYQSVGQDIHDRKEVEQALRQSQQRFDEAVRHSRQVLFRYDGKRDRYDYVSPAIQAVLGYTPEQFAHLKLEQVKEMIHPEDLGRLLGVFASAMAARDGSKTTVDVEYRMRHKQGQYVWLANSMTVLFDEQGQYDATVGSVEDITDRKQAQEGLLEYQRQLRSLASQLALAEERQRRIIAAGLHDRIGQSLAAMKLDLGMLRRSLDDAAHKDRLGEVIDNLDAVMRDTWTLTFELCPPMLYEVGLGAAVEWLIQRLGREHGLEIQLEETGEGAQLPDDQRGLMFQVVRELLSNVVKHAHVRRAVVRIDQGPEEFSLTVRDDGTGFVPSDVDPQIGHPGGFGLLGIRERLRPFGGSVHIQSQPGQGTAVRVHLPTTEETDTDERDKASDSPGR